MTERDHIDTSTMSADDLRSIIRALERKVASLEFELNDFEAADCEDCKECLIKARETMQ